MSTFYLHSGLSSKRLLKDYNHYFGATLFFKRAFKSCYFLVPCALTHNPNISFPPWCLFLGSIVSFHIRLNSRTFLAHFQNFLLVPFQCRIFVVTIYILFQEIIYNNTDSLQVKLHMSSYNASCIALQGFELYIVSMSPIGC